jgi:DNA invertase Pin-like site-specific DNA recombinase
LHYSLKALILEMLGTHGGYARVRSTGRDLAAQLAKLEAAGCNKLFKEKHSGIDAGRPELKRCLEYLREGDTLLVCCIARAAGDDYAFQKWIA